MAFTVDVRVKGALVATKEFERQLTARPLRLRELELGASGFIGEYIAPTGRAKHPAILALGGSEGGTGPFLLAAMLAARGYPVLTLAYFKAPGLPQTLSSIPLEYFVKALTWLRARPEVDPAHVVTLGISRGSEAALLLGAHYPGLVHGVIASVPTNAAICSFPDCVGAAWTKGGRPLPFTRQFNDPSPTDDPAAVIPVERIRGPVFLACAEADQVWASCAYARAIANRLDSAGDKHGHVLASLPRAGHLVGVLIPYQSFGRLSPVDAQACERVAELLAFLARITRPG